MQTRLAYMVHWLTRSTVAACLAGPALAADPLPSFEADLAGTSVSGLSSGAYMAGQFHIAFSGTLVGAAIIAGGPYDCAAGTIVNALTRCMNVVPGAPDPGELLARAQARAAGGEIDPLSNLADDRVYVFSGTRDMTVKPPVVETVPDFYRRAGVPAEQIEFVQTMPAGHALITEDTGNACGVTGTPFINDCDYDQAGALLERIYGPLAPPVEPSGAFVAFDQSEFLPDPTAHGMAATGFAYVPASCQGGGCRVHVAFHGCKQTAALPEIGETFVRRTGYNRWAESNRLIVLYPQAHAVPVANPNSCWDWWGYDDPAYATKTGRQMAAVRGMLARLAGDTVPQPQPFCARFASSNGAHWQAGRARVCEWVFLCAVGSGERLGFAVSNSTLYEHPQGSFTTQACSG